MVNKKKVIQDLFEDVIEKSVHHDHRLSSIAPKNAITYLSVGPVHPLTIIPGSAHECDMGRTALYPASPMVPIGDPGDGFLYNT